MERHPFIVEVVVIALLENSILNRITSPWLVMDQEGKIIHFNESGSRHWQALNPEALLWSGFPGREQKRFHQFLQNSWPTCWDTGEALLKLTPLSQTSGSETLGLLEWLPYPSHLSVEIFQEVSRAVNSSLILEDIFEALADVLQEHIPFDETLIVMLDETQNGIKSLVKMDRTGGIEITGEHHPFAGDDPLIDRLIHSPHLVVQQAPFPTASMLLPLEAEWVMAMPLINKGVVIGLIAMATQQAHGFLSQEQACLTQISEQLAIAVENAQLYWRTQAQASREFLINQLTRSIRQSLEIDTILTTAVQEIGKVLGVSRCFIRYGHSLSGDTPKVFEYSLPGVVSIPLLGIEVEECLFEKRPSTDTTAVDIDPFILNDVKDCPESFIPSAYFDAYQIQSLAVFPLLVREHRIGLISLHQCDAHRAWLPEDIQLLQTLAEHLGVALYQAQLFLALEQQKQKLESALQELKEAQYQLIQSEKMAVLGQFVAGIAHEVNTPLGTIASNNETIKSGLEKIKKLTSTVEAVSPLMGVMEDLLGINKLATDRIHDIVKNLRNFARLDESELKTVDLHEGIDSTLVLMRSSIPRHIRVVQQYDLQLPKVECYPGLLNQVFMNLMINAVHSMVDQPEGTLTIETHPLADTQEVEVVFLDTGKGIAPEHLPKIFDPGFTTKGRGVGTGLGLALCYRIIEKHHGVIQVYSEPGQGSRFTVRIPLSLRAKA